MIVTLHAFDVINWKYNALQTSTKNFICRDHSAQNKQPFEWVDLTEIFVGLQASFFFSKQKGRSKDFQLFRKREWNSALLVFCKILKKKRFILNEFINIVISFLKYIYFYLFIFFLPEFFPLATQRSDLYTIKNWCFCLNSPS